MLVRTVLGALIMMCLLVQGGNAAGTGDIQKYFNDTASKVKATDDPGQKRDILNHSLQTMSSALDKVQGSALISKDDRAGINQLKVTLQEKEDELAGLNGYDRVPDQSLNAFSDYVVQDMEQATQTVTISLVALLLIIIIIILVV
jgi:hypothetical protein